MPAGPPTAPQFEDEPLINIFGDSAAIRILTIINDGGGGPLPVSDIADQASVSRRAVYDNIDALVAAGFIERTDDGGHGARYAAVMDSDAMQGFMHLRDAIIDVDTDAM